MLPQGDGQLTQLGGGVEVVEGGYRQVQVGDERQAATGRQAELDLDRAGSDADRFGEGHGGGILAHHRPPPPGRLIVGGRQVGRSGQGR
jgi:hypothetical protein